MSDQAQSSTGSRLPYTVCVEGNIGCGKTTFLERCSSRREIEVLYEPIAEWTDVGGTNLLEKLYADPITWGMSFQSYVTLSMLQEHLRSNGSPIKVMERSLFSAKHCFVESMLSEGTLQEGMYQILQAWYNFIDEYHQITTDLIIYLRTTPAIAYRRMCSRGRSEEGTVTLQHLTLVIITDADKPLVELVPECENHINNIVWANQ